MFHKHKINFGNAPICILQNFLKRELDSKSEGFLMIFWVNQVKPTRTQHAGALPHLFCSARLGGLGMVLVGVKIKTV